MIRRIGRILRRVIFVCLLLAVLLWAGDVLQPKNNAMSDWPNTATFRDFYSLQPDSLDVVFLGSSHGVRAFVPQELYNSYGLTSYNLCSQEQSIGVSYYWLKEALRLHKPQVAVLDPFFVFDYDPEYPLNMEEPYVRLAMDPMQMSPVKLEAVREICASDPEHDLLSYFLPVIRFHAAWQTVTKEAFQQDHTPCLMGYRPKYNEVGIEGFKPISAGEGTKRPMNPVMEKYLERMVQLCEENGVRLLLAKVPGVPWITAEKHNAVKAFADAHDLDFIDFNEEEIFYSGLDYWFGSDSSDPEHPNHWGACKLTDYIGDFLTGEYGLEAHEDSRFEAFSEYYDAWIDQEL